MLKNVKAKNNLFYDVCILGLRPDIVGWWLDDELPRIWKEVFVL